MVPILGDAVSVGDDDSAAIGVWVSMSESNRIELRPITAPDILSLEDGPEYPFRKLLSSCIVGYVVAVGHLSNSKKEIIRIRHPESTLDSMVLYCRGMMDEPGQGRKARIRISVCICSRMPSLCWKVCICGVPVPSQDEHWMSGTRFRRVILVHC
jgi:hypothetical protein